MSIEPELYAVYDENGNELIYLGLVTDNGFETPYESFTRTKGQSKAKDISGLFEWTGDVCYFNDLYGYTYTDTKCCIYDNVTGLYTDCIDLNPDTGLCDAGVATTVYCNEYFDEWVFNIADFVEYLWDIDNNGLKLLQVRFYPN